MTEETDRGTTDRQTGNTKEGQAWDALREKALPETSKEELQALNEELATVNAELQQRLEELAASNNDLQNLMHSSRIATLFLDKELRIKRFTPAAADLFNLIPGDHGRPLRHISGNLEYEELEDDARQVLKDLRPVEREVRDAKDSFCFLVRVLPYRTVADVIEGIVLTFTDITGRKKAEQELRESEERYRRLFASMDEGFAVHEVIFDEEGNPSDFRFIEVNPAFGRLTGVDPAHVVGRTAREALPEFEATWIERFGRVVKTGQGECFEGEAVALGGWFQGFAYPTGPGRFAVTFSNITNRKRAEQALRENEERLRFCLEAGRMGVWEWDLGSGAVRWSENTWLLHGYGVGEVEPSYEAWRRPILPEDWEKIEVALQLSLEKRTDFLMEYRVLHPDGSVHWLEGRGRFSEASGGGAGRMYGVCIDIDRKKRAEQELSESEERYRLMGETIPYGVWQCNPQGEATYVSPSFLELLDMTLEEQNRFGWTRRLVPEDVEPMLCKWRHCCETGTPWDHEHRIVDRRGEIHTILSRGLPVRDERGNITSWVGVNLDITDRKRAEEELRKAKEDAEDATRAKSEFLANMSHEIRTPMTVILGSLEHLSLICAEEDHRPLIDMAETSAERLLNLINDILDVSRIEARKVDLAEEPFNLRACVERTVALFALKAGQKGLGLNCAVSPDLPGVVLGSPDRLGQILVNLVGNAVKFTERGEVSVTVEPAPSGKGYVLFSVRDTGIGIPADKRHLLFESFSQVDASRTRRFGGTGLGLAISKGLVELMGGEIGVESEEGKGSVFSFVLPLRPAAVPSPTPGSGRGEESRHPAEEPLSILVVEDDPMVRDMLGMMLRKRGWRVTTAGNGEEALAAWDREHFDVVLMDVQMPGMDGLEATRAIRERETEGGGQIPILALTAHARREDEETCLAAGMDGYLPKPIDTARLYAAVERSRKGRDE